MAKRAVCQVVRCRYHAKEARYRIKFFQEEMLFIVECLECKPPTEIVRAKVARSFEEF